MNRLSNLSADAVPETASAPKTWDATLGSLGRLLFVVSFSFYVFLHLALADVGVENYVPKYLPFPYLWNYFTGICLLAFVVSGIIGKYDKLAALLLSVYLLFIIALIHAPNAANPMELLNVFRVANMIGGAWMYAVGFAKDNTFAG